MKSMFSATSTTVPSSNQRLSFRGNLKTGRGAGGESSMCVSTSNLPILLFRLNAKYCGFAPFMSAVCGERRRWVSLDEYIQCLDATKQFSRRKRNQRLRRESMTNTASDLVLFAKGMCCTSVSATTKAATKLVIMAARKEMNTKRRRRKSAFR